jgi:hypothetical protein
VLAAPVPKADPALERIAKAYGTPHEREGCRLDTDAKGALTVKLEKVRPPKAPKPGEKEPELKLPQPTSVSFRRGAKGAFTATARFQLKTDLTKRPDDMGVSVGIWVEYPSGVSASISCSFTAAPLLGADERTRLIVAAGFDTHTNDGTPTGFAGKVALSGTPLSGEGPQHLRVRHTGKKLLLENSTDGIKWDASDELALKDTGEATVKLTVLSYHGDETEVLVDRFEVR